MEPNIIWGYINYQKSKNIYDSFPKNSNEIKEKEHIHHQINGEYSEKPLDHVFVHMFSAYRENHSPILKKQKASMYVHK